MTTLNHQDLQWILQRIPPHVLAKLKDNPGKIFLAGGFIRACIANEPPADIDLFVPDQLSGRLLAQSLAKRKPHQRPGHGVEYDMHETDNAFTIREGYKIPVQIIHRWTFINPVQCIESFDFTVARAVIWWGQVGADQPDGWQSACDDRFYQDLAAKRLVYKSPERIEEAGGSMLRVLKFYQRGYRIPLDSLGAVIARMFDAVSEEGLRVHQESFPSKTHEQTVAFVLSGLLREVDPAIDPDHIAHLPSSSPNP